MILSGDKDIDAMNAAVPTPDDTSPQQIKLKPPQIKLKPPQIKRHKNHHKLN